MGDDCASDPGSMIGRRLGMIESIEGPRDEAREFRMRNVDGVVDDGNQNTVAGGEPMGLWQVQFGQGVLTWPHGTLALLEGEAVIWLRHCDATVGLERANHVRDRTLVANPPTMKSDAGQPDGLGFNAGEAVSLRQRIERLR